MRILLLEDDHLLAKHIKKFLELKGYSVDLFTDGEELIDRANLYEYDLYIFDINVPNIDGFEVVEYIKAKHIDTPIIFISALVGIDDIKEAFRLGATILKNPSIWKSFCFGWKTFFRDLDEVINLLLTIIWYTTLIKRCSFLTVSP